MDWVHVAKLSGVAVAGSALALLAISIDVMLLGAAMILLALYYDRVLELSEDHAPRYMSKFPERDRRRLERRHSGRARLVLAALGIIWIARGAVEGSTGSVWRVPPVLLAVWFGMVLLSIWVGEILRYRVALASSTYEEYQVRYVPLVTLVFLGTWGTALIVSYIYLN